MRSLQQILKFHRVNAFSCFILLNTEITQLCTNLIINTTVLIHIINALLYQRLVCVRLTEVTIPSKITLNKQNSMWLSFKIIMHFRIRYNHYPDVRSKFFRETQTICSVSRFKAAALPVLSKLERIQIINFRKVKIFWNLFEK